MNDAALDALTSAFEACTLPKEEWTHAAHLATALRYVRLHGREDAESRMRSGIRRYIAAVGGDPAAYHETITCAWVAVVARFCAEEDHGEALAVLAERLVAQCGGKDYLLRFYTRERLGSEAARVTWIPPDLAPIDG